MPGASDDLFCIPPFRVSPKARRIYGRLMLRRNREKGEGGVPWGASLPMPDRCCHGGHSS